MASTSLNTNPFDYAHLRNICYILERELNQPFSAVKTYSSIGEIIFVFKSRLYQIEVSERDLDKDILTIEYIRQEYPELFI